MLVKIIDLFVKDRVRSLINPGPGCWKHRYLNELVKTSTRSVSYDPITQYTDIFVEKKSTAKASRTFSTKHIGVY